ncbi:MAG: hypothetical protein AAB152_15885 [Candidatus Coatesbacteria bacterium]
MLIIGVAIVVLLLVLTVASRSRRIRIDLDSPSMSPPESAPPPPPKPEPAPVVAADEPAAGDAPGADGDGRLGDAPLFGGEPAPGPACPECHSLMTPSVLFRESTDDFNRELDEFEDILEIGPALRAWVQARAPWEPVSGEAHVRVDLVACPNCRTGIMAVRHLIPDVEGFDESVDDRQEIRLAPPVVAALMEDPPGRP